MNQNNISNDDFVNNDEPYLFVSYSRTDTDYVKNALKIIKDKGHRIWCDEEIAEEGEQNFIEVLSKKIENCYAVLLFVSKGSMTSQYCGKELLTAYKYDKKVYSFALLENDKRYGSTVKVTKIIPAILQTYISDQKHIPQYEKLNKKGELDSESWKNSIKELCDILPEQTINCLDYEDETKTHIVKCRDSRRNISLVDSVRIIGEEAFHDCETLERIDLARVERIEESAFESCDELKSIYIPDTVNFIGENAFKDCDKIESVRLPNNLEAIGESCFDGCAEIREVELPDNLSDIPSRMFSGCEKLENVEFGTNVITVGESAFEDCKNLNISKLPDSLRIIGYQSLAGCDKIEELILPERLRKIGKNAFKDCSNLRTVKIDKLVDNIGSSPFRGCKKLERIEVNEANKSYRSTEIENGTILFNKNRSELICFPPENSAKKYDVPDSVTTISDWAFAYCYNLTEIDITDSVDIICENAFYSCVNLEEIYIPEGVTVIDDMAFRKCKNLKYVYIPSSVTRLGYAIFNGCTNVTIITPQNSAAYNAYSGGNNSLNVIVESCDDTEIFRNKVEQLKVQVETAEENT